MDLFTRIEDGFAVVRNRRGVLKQVPIYHRAGFAYVGVGNGFAGVRSSGGTTCPDLRMEDCTHVFQFDNLGRAQWPKTK